MDLKRIYYVFEELYAENGNKFDVLTMQVDYEKTKKDHDHLLIMDIIRVTLSPYS